MSVGLCVEDVLGVFRVVFVADVDGVVVSAFDSVSVGVEAGSDEVSVAPFVFIDGQWCSTGAEKWCIAVGCVPC